MSSGRHSLFRSFQDNSGTQSDSSSSNEQSPAAPISATLLTHDTSSSSRVSSLSTRLERLRSSLAHDRPTPPIISSSRLALMNLPSFETLDSFWDLGGSSSSLSGNDRRRRRSFDPDNNVAATEPSYLLSRQPHQHLYTSSFIPKKRRVDEGPHGQVFREVLPLQLMQCDGGTYRRRDVASSFAGSRKQYGPENVLKADDSVYCSAKSTCNMVFRHESGRCFTIEKLVIKAPGNDYTSPVSEGMVFITMDQSLSHLVERTTIRVPGQPEGLNNKPSGDEEDDKNDLDDDSEPDAMAYLDLDRTDCPYEPTLGGLSDDDEDGEPDTRETMSLMSIRAAAAAAGRSVDDINPRRTAPAREHITVTSEPKHSSDGLLEPHAHFKFLRPVNKSVITFDPPIYGRNILVKMWAPQNNSNPPNNIDIQTIAAYGYYGRRFFPATKPM